MPSLTCIDDGTLRAYLLGDLGERLSERVTAHLESCPRCEASARRLDGLTDPLLDSLRAVFCPAGVRAATSEVMTTPLPADTPGPAFFTHERPQRLGPYALLDEIGRGGMSVVYRAQQTHPSRHVAIKVILAGAHADPQHRARFLAEADVLARLQQPNIVQVFEVSEHEGLPYLVLELVSGGSLGRRLAGAPQQPRAAAALLETLARAVHHAHQCGIIHRDLKPANILLMPAPDWEHADSERVQTADPAPVDLQRWVPKISDFGLAKLERQDLTATAAILGTPSYMAPEQAAGASAGPAVDIYSLGAILYELLTGRPPFRAATALETLEQVRTQEPVPPRQLQPRMPFDLETICLKCLHKDPARRYASALDLANDLHRFLAGEPILARRTGPVERGVKWCRRRPAVATLIAGAFAGLLLLLVGALWTHRQQQATRAAALVQALCTTETPAIRPVLDDLNECRPWAIPLLRQRAEREPAGSRAWLHSRLALLPDDPGQVQVLADYLLIAQPEEVQVVRDRLAPSAADMAGPLWAVLVDPETDGPRRLRAAAALAAYAPEDPRWTDLRGIIVEQMLRENPFRAGRWSAALHPVRAALIPSLAAVHRNREARDNERVLATSVLLDYIEEPDLLAELLLDANPQQFALLLPLVRQHREPVVTLLLQHLSAVKAANKLDDVPDKQKANAVLALAQLGRQDVLWDRLRHSPDPSLRSWLVDGAAPLGIDARLLLERLDSEPDRSVQRALLLTLGSYDGKRVTDAQRAALRQRYRSDPDAGIHGALDWLLRQRWHDGAALDRIDAELRGQPPGRRLWMVSPTGVTFVLIEEPADFTMGSPDWEEERDPDEVQHRVRIPRSFALANREVTVEEFRRFLAKNNHVPKYGATGKHPTNSATWFEAAAYCRWLSELEGVPEDQMCYPPIKEIKDGMEVSADCLERTGYRLPTEAEWEYACRAGAVSSRYFGKSEELLDRYAVYRINANGRGAWPVGSLKPNDFGLFDMLGNVAEWSHDEWLEYPPAKGDRPRIDRPAASRVIAGKMRSQRGLTCVDIAPIVRSARRYGLGPENRWASIGFRVARTLR